MFDEIIGRATIAEDDLVAVLDFHGIGAHHPVLVGLQSHLVEGDVSVHVAVKVDQQDMGVVKAQRNISVDNLDEIRNVLVLYWRHK